MARLEIRDADDNVVRTVRVDDDQIVVDPPDDDWIEELQNLRVVDRNDEPVHYSEEPDAWLQGLQLNYRGIYFRGVYVPE